MRQTKEEIYKQQRGYRRAKIRRERMGFRCAARVALKELFPGLREQIAGLVRASRKRKQYDTDEVNYVPIQ